MLIIVGGLNLISGALSTILTVAAILVVLSDCSTDVGCLILVGSLTSATVLGVVLVEPLVAVGAIVVVVVVEIVAEVVAEVVLVDVDELAAGAAAIEVDAGNVGLCRVVVIVVAGQDSGFGDALVANRYMEETDIRVLYWGTCDSSAVTAEPTAAGLAVVMVEVEVVLVVVVVLAVGAGVVVVVVDVVVVVVVVVRFGSVTMGCRLVVGRLVGGTKVEK